jgi:manganese oxidase
MNRRGFLRVGGMAGAVVVSRTARGASPTGEHEGHAETRAPDDAADRRVHPAVPHPRLVVSDVPGTVVTPNGHRLPLREVGGVKVGHLIAEPVRHEFAPGLEAVVWGYNGSSPGPTIELVEGDRARFYVTNRLPEPTTVHWHGVLLPNGMDGVGGLTQAPIPPGETWVYEFSVRYPATHMYHPHFDEMTQIALGMQGMLIVHPRRRPGPRVDRDFALMTHEWMIDPGTARPDPIEMTDFNVLTFNGRVFPGTEPLLVGLGERVRIRLGNVSPMHHHPIHVHGVRFRITATDGGYVAPSAQWPETTVLVPVGSTRVIEFVPEDPGDWAMHCHMTHHVMTQMGHGFPNMVGARTGKLDQRMRRVLPAYMTMGTTGMGGMGEMDMPVPTNSLPMRGGDGPFSYIDMGGMLTILKVRENPDAADPAAWYQHPEGAVSVKADPARMRIDGLNVDDG